MYIDLPYDVKIGTTSGTLAGVTYDVDNHERPCHITMANQYTSYSYDVVMNLFWNKYPVTERINRNITIIPGIEIEPIEIAYSVGDNVLYDILPPLPKGLKIVSHTGYIYGKAEEIPDSPYFKLFIHGTLEYAEEDIIINIENVYCNEDGKWPKTLVGKTVEIKCVGTGTQSRTCNLVNGEGVWSEISGECSGMSKGGMYTLISVCSIFIVGLVISIAYGMYYRNKRLSTMNDETKVEERLEANPTEAIDQSLLQ